MSQGPIVSEKLFINDGFGNPQAIATGIWQTKGFELKENTLVSATINFNTGWTGILLVEGTNEPGLCICRLGTGPSVAWAGAAPQPGDLNSSYTGAQFWTTVQGGSFNVTNNTNTLLINLPDVGCRWIRFNFNKGVAAAIGSAVSTGSVSLYLTAKSR